MALNNRLTLDGRDVNGKYYRCRIKASGAVDVPVNWAGEMFRLKYRPESNDITSWASPSSLEIFLYQEDTNVQDFLAEVTQYQQDTYYVELDESSDGVTYSPYWRGILLQDQIKYLEASEPFVVKLTATDGLNLLKTKDANFTNTVTTGYTRTSLKDVIRLALLETGLGELYGINDDFLVTSINWWDTNQSYSARSDPFATLFLDVRAFEESVAIPNTTLVSTSYKSCFEVLEQICRRFGARIHMSEGLFWVEQIIHTRLSASPKRVVYNKGGVQQSASRTNYDIPLNESRGAARLLDNEFMFLPAFKRAQVKERQYPWNPDTQSQVWGGADYAAGTSNTRDWGVFDESYQEGATTVPNLFAVDIDFDLGAVWQYPLGSSITGVIWYAEFTMQIVLDDIASATNYYWDDDNGVWSTSPASFEIQSSPSPLQTIQTGINQGPPPFKSFLLTAALPASGRITINLTAPRFYWTRPNISNVRSQVTTGVVLTSGRVLITLNEITRQGSLNTVSSTSITATKIGNDELLDLGELELAAGARSIGNIFVHTGSAAFRAANWGVGNGVKNKGLGKLLTEEWLRVTSAPIKLYEGDVQYSNGYCYSVSFDGNQYLPMDYTLSGFRSEVQATYVFINRLTGGSFSNDFAFGLVQLGSGFDNGGDKFGKSNLIGGVFIGNGRTGNIDHGASETTIGFTALKMSAGHRTSYRQLTANAGGSSSLGVADSLCFVSWGTGSGIFTLEIPDASTMDGAYLEIILDDTFLGTAATTISIESASGNIQGGAVQEFNSQQHIILRAINGNWW